MTDRGEPGTNDTLGITVWNKNGALWYASNWNGTRTVEQVLGGGSLAVRYAKPAPDLGNEAWIRSRPPLSHVAGRAMGV
jgi:hypothetical protein